jgi:hypothetical protein
MVFQSSKPTIIIILQTLGLFVHGIVGRPVLNNHGLRTCTEGSAYSINFQKLDFEYHGDDKSFDIDIQGSSDTAQNVTAVLSVAAYGNDRYSEELNPCDPSTFIPQFCPGVFRIFQDSQDLGLMKCSSTRTLFGLRDPSIACTICRPNTGVRNDNSLSQSSR